MLVLQIVIYGFCRSLLHLVAVGVDSKLTQQFRGPWKYGDLFYLSLSRLGGTLKNSHIEVSPSIRVNFKK